MAEKISKPNPINFNTSSVDFDGIVQNLRSYLSYQTEFKDYNFEGSALSTLINLLAYNTHYNTVYDNFTLNESFLDSAYKRESVISHANLINYIPRSAKASTATVDIVIYDPNYDDRKELIPSIPSYTVFTGSGIEGSVSFYNNSTVSLQREGYYFYGRNVELKQGTYVTLEREYSGDQSQKFIIESPYVDLSTLKVEVMRDGITYSFNRADSIMDVNETSRVYFVSMSSRGLYQIEFGSGLIGYSLSAGDTVFITYLATSQNPENYNGISQFSYGGYRPADLGFSSKATIQVITTSRASGGEVIESTESIRFLAPKVYTTQNRCLTEQDYEYTLRHEFNNIRAIRVIGGQKLNPPQYGKVYISIIPKNGLTLTTADKNKILAILENKKQLTTLVDFLEPEYLYVLVKSTVHYSSKKTSSTGADITQKVKNTILEYFDEETERFGNILRFSDFSKKIDSSDQGIINNITTIRLSVNVDVSLNTYESYEINSNNKIYRPNYPSESVISGGFYCEEVPNQVCYIDDNPVNGNLRLFYLNDKNEKVVNRIIGTVDYITGKININPLTITSVVNGTNLNITVNPESNDVICGNNQFGIIDSERLEVALINDDTTMNYQQVSSK